MASLQANIGSSIIVMTLQPSLSQRIGMSVPLSRGNNVKCLRFARQLSCLIIMILIPANPFSFAWLRLLPPISI